MCEAESMIIFLLKLGWTLVCLCAGGNDSVEAMTQPLKMQGHRRWEQFLELFS